MAESSDGVQHLPPANGDNQSKDTLGLDNEVLKMGKVQRYYAMQGNNEAAVVTDDTITCRRGDAMAEIPENKAHGPNGDGTGIQEDATDRYSYGMSSHSGHAKRLRPRDTSMVSAADESDDGNECLHLEELAGRFLHMICVSEGKCIKVLLYSPPQAHIASHSTFSS